MALEEARAAGARARCRSAASSCATARWSPAPAIAPWPTAIRPRMPRCWRSARPRPRSAPSGSTDCDLYVTLEPCAMCAARGLLRPHPPALLRRRRSQGRRGRQRREVFRLADLPSSAGGLWRHWREAEAGALLKEFFRERALAAAHLRAARRASPSPRPSPLGGAQDGARLKEIERAEDADIGPDHQIGRVVLELLRDDGASPSPAAS